MGDGLAGARARPRVGVHACRGIHVVARDHDRPAHGAHRGEGGQGHHVSLVVAHFQLLDVLDRAAKAVQGLHVDLPGAAEAVEVVDVVGAEGGLQGGAQVVDGDAAILGLGAVDDQLQPGRIGAKAGEQALQVRVILAGNDDLLGHFLKGFEAVVVGVLDDDLEAARRAQALHRRGAKEIDHGVGHLAVEALLQRLGDGVGLEFRPGPVLEVIEHQIERAEVRGIGVQQDRLAGDGDGVLDALGFQGDLLDALDHLVGARHGGGVGELHVDQQIALVLLRDEAGGGAHEPQPSQAQQPAVDQQH